MTNLENFGFKKIGNLYLDKNNSKIKQNITNGFKSIKNSVYAIATDDEIIYIGETSQNLSERLSGHCNGNTDPKDTDNRTKDAINDALSQRKEVGIWCLEIESCQYKFPNGQQVSVSIRQPIEDFLINELEPKINKKGKNRSKI